MEPPERTQPVTSIASGASSDEIAPVISEDEALVNAEFQRRHWVDRTVEDRWFETFAAMREKEVSRPFFHFDSMEVYCNYRKKVTDWIFELIEVLGFQRLTAHLSIHYFVVVLNKVSVSKNRLQLVAAISFLIACKMEEDESLVPTLSDMARFCANIYTFDMLSRMELLILKTMDFSLCAVLPLHFLEFYLEILAETEPAGRTLVEWSRWFVDLSVTVYSLCAYPPSVIAAACLAAARSRTGLTPPLPTVLFSWLQWSAQEQEQVEACLTELANVYDKSSQQHQLQASPNTIHGAFQQP